MKKDEYMLPPYRQRFYYVFALVLNLLGLSKRIWWGYKPIHYLVHLHGEFVVRIGPICTVTQLLYLYVYYNDLTFDVIGIVLTILPVSVLVNINVRSARRDIYKRVMELFMTKIHISNYFIERNDHMRQKLLTVERFTRFTALYLSFFFGLNWVAWISIPVLNNINNKKGIMNKTMRLETCVYLWMPFDYTYNYINWIVVHIINVYIVAIGTSIMATLHCLNYIFIYHLISHIQVLKITIRSGFVDDISNEEVKRRLVGIIKHHAFIIRVFDDVQSAFGINVAANYMHNLLSDSLIMYQILNGGDIMSYGAMVGAYIGELVFMSFVIEEMRKQSDDLPDLVYAIPWENMSVSNKKIVTLLLSRVQTQMQFVALGGFNAGVRPMVSIIKTTFSYYVMLKSSIEPDTRGHQ